MNRKIIAIIFISFILIKIVSCSTLDAIFNPPERGVNVEISLSDIEYENFIMAGTTLYYDISIKNKTKYDIIIIGYKYSLTVPGVSYEGSNSEEIKIKADETKTIRIKQYVNFHELAQKIPDFTGREELEITTKGTFQIKSIDQEKDVEFDHTGKMSIPTLPTIVKKDISIEEIDYNAANILFNFEIDNKNPFEITFTPSYTIQFNNNEILKVQNGNPFIV